MTRAAAPGRSSDSGRGVPQGCRRVAGSGRGGYRCRGWGAGAEAATAAAVGVAGYEPFPVLLPGVVTMMVPSGATAR